MTAPTFIDFRLIRLDGIPSHHHGLGVAADGAFVDHVVRLFREDVERAVCAGEGDGERPVHRVISWPCLEPGCLPAVVE